MDVQRPMPNERLHCSGSNTDDESIRPNCYNNKKALLIMRVGARPYLTMPSLEEVTSKASRQSSKFVHDIFNSQRFRNVSLACKYCQRRKPIVLHCGSQPIFNDTNTTEATFCWTTTNSNWREDFVHCCQRRVSTELVNHSQRFHITIVCPEREISERDIFLVIIVIIDSVVVIFIDVVVGILSVRLRVDISVKIISCGSCSCAYRSIRVIRTTACVPLLLH